LAAGGWRAAGAVVVGAVMAAVMAMAEAESLAAEVAVVAGLLAVEVVAASVVAVASAVVVAAAAGSGSGTSGSVVQPIVAAAHPGERAARAKSHDLTAASPGTLLSCDKPRAVSADASGDEISSRFAQAQIDFPFSREGENGA
jgi:hypothetical protein